MAEYLDVERAKELSGIRLVLTEGVPGPWGEAAKGLLHVKGLPFVRVRQVGGAENAALQAWTGSANAPQLVCDDEPARCGWTEIIACVERLAPNPALVPSAAEERAAHFGLIHLIAGEDGLGWLRRLMGLPDALTIHPGHGPSTTIGHERTTNPFIAN